MDLKTERRSDTQDGAEDDAPLGPDLGPPDDGDLSAEEIKFLEEFPRWKQEQEEVIEKLYALAEDTDATHKKFTKTNMVAKAIGMVSGVSSVLGLALTPVTAGGSLILTSASQGVGLTATVISTVADLWENSHNEKTSAQSSHLVPSRDREFQEGAGGQMASYVRASGEIVYRCGSTCEVIRKHARALRLAKAHPHLVSAAKHLRNAGQVSGPVHRHVQKAFKDTALTMSKNSLRASGAFALLSFGQDVFDFWKMLRELKDTQGTELAKKLRGKALELEEELLKRTEKYEMLQEKKLKREESLKRSSPKGAKETQTQLASVNGKAGPQGTGEKMARASP